MTDPKVIQAMLSVVVTWLCVWAMLEGCGHLARRWLFAMQGGPRTLSRADLWIGLAALVAYLQLWTLAATRVARERRVARHLGYAAVTSALVAGLWIVASLQAFETWPASGPGPFGAPGEPTPAVTSVVTRSGLRLVEPAGSVQCWGTILCAPSPDPRLRLRGKGIADGFTLGPG